ncbi:unnamed protein product [Schistocephalus solidus]|uniref:Recep_L_domain domain-containing protein n=1 Tax=Schistocephalus solidus TaxID=70667 RepID=A0A183TPZ3_SCHSO|nr:unnamed protein product [Schistocephalus solidus]
MDRISVCGDYDVRRAASLTRIQSCTVIEGNLLILMTKLPVTASVPNLREITGYLVIYDLTGLESLSTLFPNLTVIRGQSLIYNYALVIRSTTLKYIGLPSLRVIQRGGVRIDLNANLCYVRTVNWTEILGPQSPAAAPVRHLSNRLICPENCPAECSNGLDSSVPTGALIAIGSNSNNSNSPKSQLREDNKLASPARGHCWSPLHCQSGMCKIAPVLSANVFVLD